MGITETAKTLFCLEKCMILVSVPVCYKFSGRKGFFRDGTGINHGKNRPLEETRQPCLTPQQNSWNLVGSHKFWTCSNLLLQLLSNL